jgi:hypothetical protein
MPAESNLTGIGTLHVPVNTLALLSLLQYDMIHILFAFLLTTTVKSSFLIQGQCPVGTLLRAILPHQATTQLSRTLRVWAKLHVGYLDGTWPYIVRWFL